MTSLLINCKQYYQSVESLSQQARCLWGKTDKEDPDLWLPLHVHLSDTVAIAEKLWDLWAPTGTKRVIADALRECLSDDAETRENDTDDGQFYLGKAKFLFLACAAVHDVGKATPEFQRKAEFQYHELYEAVYATGLPFLSMSTPHAIPHALASQGIMDRQGWSRNIAVVLGGHHGKPPSLVMLHKLLDYDNNTGFNNQKWVAVQDELVKFALGLIGLRPANELFCAKIGEPAQVILTGLLIMADWIASDESRFNYVSNPVLLNLLASPQERSDNAWSSLDWPKPWKAMDAWNGDSREEFFDRFGLLPRPVQEAVIDALEKTTSPGIMVIEAPMGEGKTEAALAAAEIMATKTGRGGLFIALPTQATSDGLFPRVEKWIGKLGGTHTVSLLHGKAQFNPEYQELFNQSPSGFGKNGHPEFERKTVAPCSIGIDEEKNQALAGVMVGEWFQGRKKSILSDFVVGTVDQVLMGGLKQKHLALRHLALSNKVVIIDECHAYDAYMSQYLCKVLEWLGVYRVPVVVLSATLPVKKRQSFIDAYTRHDSTPKKRALAWIGRSESITPDPDWVKTTSYPLLTYTDTDADATEPNQIAPAQSSRSLTVSIQRIDDEAIVDQLKELLVDGGCAGVIVNTVARAQEFAKRCRGYFGEEEVELFHSQFIAPDRIEKENGLRKKLGLPIENECRPDRLIVIGTQVLEQSLDIDFDVLFTDICPMDLLIQRMGRMHRHDGRERPPKLKDAQCFVMGYAEESDFNKGSIGIYGRYLLMNTDFLLPSTLALPDNISSLVQRTYGELGLDVPADKEGDWQQAFAEFKEHIHCQENKAQDFQISDPKGGGSTLVDWLDTSVEDRSGKRGEATVRDSADSIEVLVIQRLSDGTLRLLPWRSNSNDADSEIASVRTARLIAQCSVKLPARLCMPWNIEKTIYELEVNNMRLLPDSWQESVWLQGELFLVLDEGYRVDLNGYSLRYDKNMGLLTKRKED